MNRYARDKRENYPRPVERVELSDNHVSKKRIILFCVAVAVALIAFATALFHILNKDSGWQRIELDSSSTAIEHSEEINFSYELGVSGTNTSVEYKALYVLFKQAMEEAYANLESEAILPEMECFGDYLYIQPVYEYYQSIFFCEDDYFAAELDPRKNDEALANVQAMLNQKDFFGYSWLANAYVVDYIADFMVEHGYTNGTVASFDGFSRRLQSNEAQVILRANPKYSLDIMHYYAYDDGTIINSYINPETGLCLELTEDKYVLKEDTNCVSILSEMMQSMFSTGN